MRLHRAEFVNQENLKAVIDAKRIIAEFDNYPVYRKWLTYRKSETLPWYQVYENGFIMIETMNVDRAIEVYNSLHYKPEEMAG